MAILLTLVAVMHYSVVATALLSGVPQDAVNVTCEFLNHVRGTANFSKELSLKIEENSFVASESRYRTTEEVRKAVRTYLRAEAAVGRHHSEGEAMARAGEAAKAANDAEEQATKAELRAVQARRRANHLVESISRRSHSILTSFKAVLIVFNQTEADEDSVTAVPYNCPERDVQNVSREVLETEVKRMVTHLEPHIPVPRQDIIHRLVHDVGALNDTAVLSEAALRDTMAAEAEAKAAATNTIVEAIRGFKDGIESSPPDDAEGEGDERRMATLAIVCLLLFLSG
ncbi:uncharacterized protein TEOVI_000500100 [Trypanosoma equiperdum]|nr:hypothetical protein, conserved [Trypanosoma equiperdum]